MYSEKKIIDIVTDSLIKYKNLEVAEGMARLAIMERYNLNSNFNLDGEIVKVYVFNKPENLEDIKNGRGYWKQIEFHKKETIREYKLNNLLDG